MYPKNTGEVDMGTFPDIAAFVAECFMRGLRRIDIATRTYPVCVETGKPVPMTDIIAEMQKTEYTC